MSNIPGINFKNNKIFISDAKPVPLLCDNGATRDKTIAYKLLNAHCANSASGIHQTETRKTGADKEQLNITFDALISHDITYVSIIQTARAAGLTGFPVPYALTNCHNSLCAVGGTINEDDHAFGLSAAQKYGGIYVPANHAVIHQYAREVLTGCGKMILGSDSHTRYGCYGTLGIGEGGGELVKQLLGQTYDITPPEVILVWLEGSVRSGIGPHDVALALIAVVFPEGKVKNKVLEFAGPGVSSLSMDFRAGIDVMTTETSCLTSVWETDAAVLDFYKTHGRESDYAELKISDGACYDGIVNIDLSRIESMIALPFHPSKAFTIHELIQNAPDILHDIQNACNNEIGSDVKIDLLGIINSRGGITCRQGIIVGCAGGLFDNISEAADILSGKSVGNGYFDLSVYPASTPVSLEIIKHGISETLMKSGAVIKNAFCGPCFGAGDTPAHNTLSIRHATRNFAGREGSKPASGQIAAVALMDARSIAATAINGGVLTAATDIDYNKSSHVYSYDGSIYEKRCYSGYGKADASVDLCFGPNITDWPEFTRLENNLLIKICAVIRDDVTTTDELIPSGDTSSYRSNPLLLSEFTLSRRVPEYVRRSKETMSQQGIQEAEQILAFLEHNIRETSAGTCIFAKKPGDGSAREQAASCQRVLGGRANICYEYATKRYRSNCINWGIIPFTISKDESFDYQPGDWIFIAGIRDMILSGKSDIPAKIIKAGNIAEAGNIPGSSKSFDTADIMLKCEGLSDKERKIITDGCLINYYKTLLTGASN